MHPLSAWVWAGIHSKSNRFFRLTLLRSSPENIKKLIEQYEKDVAGIKKSALTMVWYMRGGVSYEDILNMSHDERVSINEIIENNLEVTKKTQLPFF